MLCAVAFCPRTYVKFKSSGTVHTIIIDEISMVSYKTLGFIHQRLTEIKGTNDTEEYFGGLNIIAVGDFYQLPPVRGSFVFGHVPTPTSMVGPIFNGGTPYKHATKK